MKVLLINGSPRMNGNTNRALEECAAALQTEGIDTEIAWITNKEIRGCIACGICTRTGNNQCIFTEDCCNELIQKAGEADGLIIGSPVYYAGAAGSLVSLLDRMFYAGGSVMRFKPAAGIGVARRAGAIEAADQINKYFQINNMPVISSSYWGIAFGRQPGETAADGEGMHTMRMLGRNMAWMLKSLEAAKAAGVNPPEVEPKVMTNYIREDVIQG